MICVIATIETAAGRRDDLLAVLQTLVPKVLAEKGCIEYAPMIDTPSGIGVQGPIRPNVVTMVEKWQSLAALEAHLNMPHMATFFAQTADMGLSLTIQVLKPA